MKGLVYLKNLKESVRLSLVPASLLEGQPEEVADNLAAFGFCKAAGIGRWIFRCPFRAPDQRDCRACCRDFIVLDQRISPIARLLF